MFYDSMYEQMYLYQSGTSISPKNFRIPYNIFNGFYYVYHCFISGCLNRSAFIPSQQNFKIIIPLSLWLIFQIGSVIILFIDFKFADNKIIEAFLKFIQWLEESVYHLTAVLPCIAVLLTAIAFLFVRRVPLNDNKNKV